MLVVDALGVGMCAGVKPLSIDQIAGRNDFINIRINKTLYKYSHKSIGFDKLRSLFNFQSSF
jgi:hypothetical protein